MLRVLCGLLSRWSSVRNLGRNLDRNFVKDVFSTLLWVFWIAACASPTPTPTSSVDAQRQRPSWLAEKWRDATDLADAAALLCARGTDGVVDAEVRRGAGVWDGIVVGAVDVANEKTPSELFAQRAPVLLDAIQATHVGSYAGVGRDGGFCQAVVGVRRLVLVRQKLRAQLGSGEAQKIQLEVPSGHKAMLYLLGPSGFVEERPVGTGTSSLVLPAASGDGNYTLEIMVDDEERAPRDPKVALLWPYVVGKERLPPFPEVLFPDDGDSDDALTHRAEALVQRLRNEQLIEPFKISPALAEIARVRADHVASRGTLGHAIDGVGSVVDDVKERAPLLIRVAEIQAQGSTLADAWQALTDSPAHRRVLVDQGLTHVGVSVVRGKVAAGRKALTLLAVLGRKPLVRDVHEVRETLFLRIHRLRESHGLDPVQTSAHLQRMATRLAGRMAEIHMLDERALGEPVAALALASDASFTQVIPLVGALDDPLLFFPDHGVPPILLDVDVNTVGLAFALDPTSGVFYACLLAGM